MTKQRDSLVDSTRIGAVEDQNVGFRLENRLERGSTDVSDAEIGRRVHDPQPLHDVVDESVCTGGECAALKLKST